MKSILYKYINIWLLAVVIFSSSFLVYSEFVNKHKLKIIFLDVGQGDATLIITPLGRQVLIDAGKYTDISKKIALYMPISDRSIDMFIATHPDIDHIAGFNTLLDEYRVQYFIHSGLLAGAPIYRKIAQKINDKNIMTHAAIAGEKIFIEKDIYLEILSPYKNKKIEDPNDYSIVLRLVHKNKAILLMGDASMMVEKDLIQFYGKKINSEILKVGHHGSKTSTASRFVKVVAPEYGIISAGCGNTFGHPHASVLRSLDEHQVEDLQTCERGDIIFEFKDKNWVLQNKKSH